MWSSEPLEDLAVCRAKEVPSFVSYLRPWVLVWPRELNVWPSPLRSSALPTELILPPAHFSIVKNHTNLGLFSLWPWLSCLLLWNLLTGQWNNLLQSSQYIHGGVLSLVWLFLSWGQIFTEAKYSIQNIWLQRDISPTSVDSLHKYRCFFEKLCLTFIVLFSFF